MLVTVDVSDLHLGSNHLFRLLEPYLLDCALNYCASYRYMEYEKFHTEMIEYLFDGTLWDEDFNDDIVVMDRINDLEEHEFNTSTVTKGCVKASWISSQQILAVTT